MSATNVLKDYFYTGIHKLQRRGRDKLIVVYRQAAMFVYWDELHQTSGKVASVFVFKNCTWSDPNFLT